MLARNACFQTELTHEVAAGRIAEMVTPGQAFIETCRQSAAYHEAGHEVICIAQEIPVLDLGVHVDSKMNGLSLTLRCNPGDPTNTITEREQSIILLNAGYIAQKVFLPDTLPESGEHDQRIVDLLLDEMHQRGSQAQNDLREKLWEESHKLVEQHWAAIESLAYELWARPWVNRVPLPPFFKEWSTDTKEKWLHGEEVRQMLQPFGLQAHVQRFTDGSYIKPKEQQSE